ncbi:MAG: cupin domain-containing protein [Sphaerochaeta sp.]|uniref:cupin domain-containing protein n=1 Tax=Sphaerochaeta sp. TaxID=1972642 RepID=UPI003D09C374
MKPEVLIAQLGLEPLAGEGGYFRRVHTFCDGEHALGSSIYYLITEQSFSSLHYLLTDEVWYFLEGSDIEQLVLHPDGSHSLTVLGHASAGKPTITVVGGGCWQATKLLKPEGWALCATTMCPPYEDGGYRQGTKDLIDLYPGCPRLSEFLGEEA